MLDTSGHSAYQVDISGTVSIIPRGEFAHKTYHFSSFIIGKSFNEILKLLEQIEVAINEIVQRDPDIKAGLQAGRSHEVSFYFKE